MVRVIDGDTIICDIDLGYHVTVRWAVRIDGLACAELRTEEGKAQRAYAIGLLPVDEPVQIVSKKLLGSFEKYGRVLGDLAFAPPSGPRTVQGSYATAMIAAGMGVPWDGTGAQPTG